MLDFPRAGSSLGSARIWAREPGVLRSSARSSQAFWKLGQARGIFFSDRTFSEAGSITNLGKNNIHKQAYHFKLSDIKFYEV